jgi:hypothetical protein
MQSLDAKDRAESTSPIGSKASTPYPSFSKAHSKEAVGSREAIMRPKLNIFTPDPTDLDTAKSGKQDNGPTTTVKIPPSPPLTAVDENSQPGKKEDDGKEKVKVKVRSKSKISSGSLKKSSTVSKPSTPVKKEEAKKDESKKARVEDGFATPVRGTSPVRNATPARGPSGRSTSPARNATPNRIRPTSPTRNGTPAERAVSPIRIVTPSKPPPAQVSSPSPPALAATETTELSSRDSDATSIAPNQVNQQPIIVEPSELSRTPIEVFIADDRSITGPSPAPPPPPPPPAMPVSVPKVDYLLQYGGLTQTVPKTLLSAAQPDLQPVVARAFEPYHRLLDDFTNVISKNGSLAVATGYRSVARRLLDRLEAVFARDISSETCQCIMCQPNEPNADESGVSWGEVLELVSGRKDLPTWPAFAIVPSPVGLGINLETQIPMQKLDVDVPEEYRDHYVRQSRKTKQTVDKWLARQISNPTSPPEEVDDETLTFAILTHLDAEQRPTFTGLLGVPSTPIADRAPTPRIKPESLSLASKAIQRLYRLPNPPREPETAIYLLNNPTIHNVLATLAAISNDEWDILISGRFDGFLRSGAEDIPSAPSPAPRTLSRSTSATPSFYAHRTSGSVYNLSRGPTPATYGAPIALDEETEIATLAEIEREIYLGMEALEDAFEALHCKAEAVRRALRERNTGLTMASQARRGSMDVEVRLGTPASGLMGNREWDEGSVDGDGVSAYGWVGDDVSELAPDDSASNISSSRRRRPKRRNERRTPAMVEEMDEDEVTEGSESPVKR